ncbi:MAG: hypothetical protein KDE56_30965, partial [Anaerolineales bacterium]|nr:hypothetical protein [Anaerolineales bacterium]
WTTYLTVKTDVAPAWDQVLTWQSTTNPCQRLMLTLSGIVQLFPCDDGAAEVGWMMIPPDYLAQLYRWVDELAVTKTAVFTLNSHGDGSISPDQEDQINYFAQNLAATIASNAANNDLAAIEPIAEAAYFTVAGWSADSQWLAYWASTRADVDAWQPQTMPGGTLRFANVISGEQCEAKELHTATDAEGAVYWQADNQVVASLPNGTFSGRPCEPFTPLPDFVPPQPASAADPSLSIDGRYRAATTSTTNDDNTLTVTTIISDAQTETAVNTVTWHHPGGLGDLGLGGIWVSPTQFLTFTDLTQGPLLIDVDKGVIPVLTGLPGLSLTQPDTNTYIYEAQGIPGKEADQFVLILYGVGIEAEIPPITLYHAASGMAETLPFRASWGFSQNKEWLFLYESRSGGNHIWGRHVADVGGGWQLIASTASSLLWNPEETEVAFSQRNTKIVWQTFPNSTPLGEWGTEPYWVYPVMFSPNGRYLVAQGNLPGTWQYGLFIFEPIKRD